MARKERAGGKQEGKARGKRAKRRPAAQQRGKGARRATRAVELVDHQLMRALARAERIEILAILTERIASPKELAAETGEDLSTISYHVRNLRDCGLIELDHKIPRRGAMEHFYRAVDRTLLPPNALNGPASDLSLTPLVLDDQGLEEVGKRTEDYLEGLLDVQANATKRLEATGSGKHAAKEIAATLFLASFLSIRSAREGRKASARKRR